MEAVNLIVLIFQYEKPLPRGPEAEAPYYAANRCDWIERLTSTLRLLVALRQPDEVTIWRPRARLA